MVEFEPIKGVEYKYRYNEVFRAIANGEGDAISTYKALILDDLFFIIYFVMEVPHANHPFIIKCCQEVENGPKTKTLDIWARGHFKSTIVTVAETVQYHLKYPNHCTCIFSYKKPAAEDFLDSVRKTWEMPMMTQCFPEELYEKPDTQSASWSLQNGVTIRRSGKSRKEATVEASGLVEGMLTGKHFERRIYDDVETDDIKNNPDQLKKCFSKFEMSNNLGVQRDDEIVRIIGTYYSHSGPLINIRDKETTNGDSVYVTRIKPATDDGTISGKPVFLSEQMLEDKKTEKHFNSQQLCDPTPTGVRKLDASLLRPIEHRLIPNDIYKFMTIDQAGDSLDGQGDAWSIQLWGVEPHMDDIGASNIYLLDAFISPLRHSEAIDIIVTMYLNGGFVQQLGVEKVGLATTDVHIVNALAAKGRYISTDNNTLVFLKPTGRNKVTRIESALSWPLYNSKIFISTNVPELYVQRFKDEMDKFPHWHDDGLDGASYLYDMMRDFNFPSYHEQVVPEYVPDNNRIGY